MRYWYNSHSARNMPFQPNFYTWGKARRHAERSCLIFKDSSPCRKKLVWLVTSPIFDTIITLAVILNTIFIMLPSYNFMYIDPQTMEPLSYVSDGCCDSMIQLPNPCDPDTPWDPNLTAVDPATPCLLESCALAKSLENITACCACPAVNMAVGSIAAEWFFLIVFLIEMILKMVAFGVLPGPPAWYGSYFTDGWNVLDFIIVVAALVGAPFPAVVNGQLGIASAAMNIGFLRVIRVLRPLRTLSMIPAMRNMVNTLLVSISELTAVLLLLIFIFLMFGALMIQVYSGELRYRCRLTNFPLAIPRMNTSHELFVQDVLKSSSDSGLALINASVNWCTWHDDWDNLQGGWQQLGGFDPPRYNPPRNSPSDADLLQLPTRVQEGCDWSKNSWKGSQRSTLHNEVFYLQFDYYPTALNDANAFSICDGKSFDPSKQNGVSANCAWAYKNFRKGYSFATKRFYYARVKDWHWKHMEAMSSNGDNTYDPMSYAMSLYQTAVKSPLGLDKQASPGDKFEFAFCSDNGDATLPISYEQCYRICYNQQVDSNGQRFSPCDVREDTEMCRLWKTRPFDIYNQTKPKMCEKYCKEGSTNWDIQNLKSPSAGTLSPWYNVTDASMPFYNGHKLCFWPNDFAEDTTSANRFCSDWFKSNYDDAHGHNKCPASQYCGSDFDATGNLRFHSYDVVNTAIYSEDLLWGVPQFNNFPEAFLSIFQSITLEGWVDILYTVSCRMSCSIRY